MRVVSQTEALGQLARDALDATVTVGLTDARALRSADVIVLAHPDWDRIWGWRVGGLTTPVVVNTLGVPERDRARLEPLVLIREPSVAALADALRHLKGGQPLGVLSTARGVIDLAGSVFRPTRGDPVTLTSREVRLLGYLGARSNRAVPREELRLQVWEHVRPVPGRSVDMAVSRVRQKIERNPRSPKLLVTVRNAGYRLMVRPPRRPRKRPRHALVGRSEILARISDLGSLTLWGPPGVGTTRLAVEAAGPGAIFIDLEGVGSVRVALAEIARAALLPSPPADIDQAYQDLAEGLAAQDSALVIDRVEGVSGVLAPLNANGVRFIATSRRRIDGIPGLRVGPLSSLFSSALLDLELGRLARDADPDWRAAAVESTGGFPKAILESSASPDPPALSDLWSTLEGWRCGWHQLEPESRALLTLLSRFTHVDARLAADVGGLHAKRAWRELESTGFVADGRVPPFAANIAAEMHPAGWMSAGHVHLDHCITRAQRGETVSTPDLCNAIAFARHNAIDARVERLIVARDRMDAQVGTPMEVRRARLDDGLASLGRPLGVLFRLASLLRNRDRPRAQRLFEEVYLGAEGTLRCEAGIALAGLLWLTDGPQAADDLLTRLEPPNRTLELVVLAERAQLRDFLEHPPGLHLTQAVLVDLMEELAIEGARSHAVRVGLQVERRARVTGIGDRPRLMTRLSQWATECDALLRAHVDVIHGTVLPAGEEREAVFSRAEAVFERVQPIRLWQVRFQRAQLALDAGERAAARSHLEAYRAWAARNRSVADVGDIDLWLCAVFADDSDWHSLARTADAVRQRCEEPHYVATAMVWRSVAAFFLGGALVPPDESHLSPVALRWWRALPSAGLPWPADGQVPALDAVWEGRRAPRNASERLIARLRSSRGV